MSDPKPNPTLNAEGLPLCSEDACALYDGKRCRAIGFRPDTYCEPALVEIIAERDALKARVAELERRPAPVEHAAHGRCTCSYDDSEEMTRHAVQCRMNQAATTIEQAPPDGLLDQTRCPHRRVSMRPSPHGLPETTCLDCGEPTNP